MIHICLFIIYTTRTTTKRVKVGNGTSRTIITDEVDAKHNYWVATDNATIVLFSVGLVVLVGYMMLRRQRNA